MNAEPQIEDVMDGTDYVREYARVKAALSQARRDALKSLHYTEDGLKDLEANAIAQMGEDSTVTTEYGTVQTYQKPIFVRKAGIQMGSRTRIHHTTREQ